LWGPQSSSFFLLMGPLWLENPKEILKVWRLPQYRNIHSNHTNLEVPLLDNIGQSIWDKVRCYWEHVEEHIGNLIGTHCELDENTLVTTKVQMIQHPPPPKEKKMGCKKNLCIPPFFTFFDLGVLWAGT
jgi:hypothetical protein